MGKLVAELIDSDCMAVSFAEQPRIFLVEKDTAGNLRAADPIDAMLKGGRLEPPVVKAPDEEIRAATLKARKTWPRFVKLYKKAKGHGCYVKVEIVEGEHVEHLWARVTEITDTIQDWWREEVSLVSLAAP